MTTFFFSLLIHQNPLNLVEIVFLFRLDINKMQLNMSSYIVRYKYA